MGLTTDKESPCLNVIQENGQQACYLVLSDEERAKGFIRPVRRTYVHIGQSLAGLMKHTAIELPDDKKYDNFTHYAEYEESFRPLAGRNLTKQGYDDLMSGKTHTGGCGYTTKMDVTIAETYARDPKFYGGTFCVGCGKHLPVGEFRWYGTDELVGS